ncbi:hypothetical protein [Tenacibaculum finnmarkense]|uniref:hypothetical protein n=1 Tax=Tenacibaculum finnmarkense TaxID=2781243 RepID=UPI001EFB8236|nr:hypothetical protein [Tenacibaculum finnmarkense]MCG8796589.1 hypothetical protein [Tenacibaculum finnmarkense]MCG8798992.1 hypothetical protein [Tenacibaculum finnmarkense]
MEKEHPAWLKAMQNGTLGEARTKAFLLDRFWILERSVDIDGADFIIQRRITQTSILDPEPPRMGIVQVKFFSTPSTTQFIHKDYVINKQGKVRNEFFLICHTGVEENARVFFLTAEAINTDFFFDESSGKFKILGSKILNTNKYLVSSKKNTLDRIETRLQSADYRNNKLFISSRLYNSISDTQAILPDYQEPIRNSWGHIPTEFKNIKDSALKAMSEIEEIYNSINKIVEEIDPLEAFSRIEDLNSELGSATYGHWGRDIMESLYSDDFYYTCKEHKEKVEILRQDGLLDNFIKLRQSLKDNISEFLSENYPFNPLKIHLVILNFKPKNFSLESIDNELVLKTDYLKDKKELEEFENGWNCGIKQTDKHSFEYYWKPSSNDFKGKKKNEIKEYFANNIYRIYDECIEKIYELEYNK